ncbi:Rieske (2Fe-2S) domain protein [Synechococcus sp. PCC 7335]|uniref:Rieske 2Fe-2S domain-containing protein n=1 Tax=Synechococcus sp. (strain ATCC 29403 / PCC 7335) TaxID=91464 RepID=UPI00017EE377|nr:Rieske 2Fe-2S domain-containing protein [Synechococcus sp. PCC 7335]EDX86209.1 Rieske (2Fe-2S) domain protein [Synechococcus sp. PCC 7335]
MSISKGITREVSEDDAAVLSEEVLPKEMLPGAPWLLAHKSMLSVNQPVKVSLYGCDYVLWKDSNGTVQALPNCCPHMSAMLSEGWCAAQTDGSSKIVCPFHALAFDGAGCTVLPESQQGRTLPQMQPLDLVVQGDFIWSYGGAEPKIPIPDVLNEIVRNYQLVGVAGEVVVDTPLLPMLLNMHDYNHQNGTHREMFRIKEVRFERFVDKGHYSEAFMRMPKAASTLGEILKNPAVLMMPKMIEALLENYFPSIVVFHGESFAGPIVQCHFFVPESAQRTRTYVLLFSQPKSPIFWLIKDSFLKLVATVVEQDADILSKLYTEQPQKIKLNNEVGMDWVRRNFESWPEIAPPNLSR